MKNENLIALIKELMSMDEMREEFQDNNSSFSIDSKKENNKLIITVSYKENTDKKDFENWVQKLDDDIFTETWENLSEKYGLDKLNKIYQTPEYNKVIKLFKEQATQLAKNKIMTLSNLFDLN